MTLQVTSREKDTKDVIKERTVFAKTKTARITRTN